MRYILNEADDFDLSELDDLSLEDDDNQDNQDNSMELDFNDNLEDSDFSTLEDGSALDELDIREPETTISKDPVDNSNQLVVLKKRADSVIEQWKDLFQQISDLARALNLVAKYDDDFKIYFEKSNLNKVNKEVTKSTAKLHDNSITDDDFGPSGFEERAEDLSNKDNELHESLFSEVNRLVSQQKTSTDTQTKGPINEVPLDLGFVDSSFKIDDDF